MDDTSGVPVVYRWASLDRHRGRGPGTRRCVALAAAAAIDYRACKVLGLSRTERHASRIARLHAASGAARWGVTGETFGEAIEASLRHRWPGTRPPDGEVARYLESLAIEDLALACGCRAGNEAAWEHFVRELRPTLHAAARAIAGEAGPELADGLYADLFGLAPDRPDRRSLLAYYHGRSRLTTWLRAVLARRHIDRLRAERRLEPIDDPEDERRAGDGVISAAADPERSRFVGLAQQALDEAVAGLDAADRLRLRLYYGNDLTLAAIGRLLGEHEATVSRKLERARRRLRTRVEGILRDRHGLDAARIAACFDHAAAAPELQLTRLLASGEDG